MIEPTQTFGDTEGGSAASIIEVIQSQSRRVFATLKMHFGIAKKMMEIVPAISPLIDQVTWEGLERRAFCG